MTELVAAVGVGVVRAGRPVLADVSVTAAAGEVTALTGPSGSGKSTLMAALDSAGVPFEVVGLGGLLTMPEVADIVGLLQVVDDPTRGDHLMRLLTGPLVHLGAADIAIALISSPETSLGSHFFFCSSVPWRTT